MAARGVAKLQRALRVGVGRGVDDATKRLVQAWARAYVLIQRDLIDAAEVAAALGPLSPEDFRVGRLGRAMDAAASTLDSLATFSGVTVNAQVRPAVQASAQAQAAYVLRRSRGMSIAFNALDEGALDAIVRRTTQRIASNVVTLSRDAQRSLRDELVRGVSRGTGAREVGRLMQVNTRGIFGGGLTRAVTIARTEVLDASREGARRTYTANGGLLDGWVWSSALDRRTCPACWAMHGKTFPTDYVHEGHQQCRCAMVPLLAGEDADEVIPQAERTFRNLPREQQVAIMGPGRMTYLDNGGAFDALAQRRENPAWRASRVPTPVRALQA